MKDQKIGMQNMNEIQNGSLISAVDAVCTDFVVKMSEKIEHHPVYRQLVSAVKSDKTILYFQSSLKKEIFPYIVQIVNDIRDSKHKGIWIPSSGIFSLLREYWPSEEVPINDSLKNALSYFVVSKCFSIKEFMQNTKTEFVDFWNRCWQCCGSEGLTKTYSTIAVHYAEGLTLKRRSDISWFPQSGIEASHLLIYFDKNGIQRRYAFEYSIPEQILEKLKELGMKWIFIPKGIITGMRKGVWIPDKTAFPEWVITLKNTSDEIGKWILNTGRKLLKEVDCWKKFFVAYNVKVLFLPEECNIDNLVQGIAFDLLGEKSGITVGKQRSDFGDHEKTFARCHTKNVMFTWNSRSTRYFKPEYNKVISQIVVGHPNDCNFFQYGSEQKDIRRKLISHGTRFIIGLLDSGHKSGGYCHFKTTDMESFYRAFLLWVLEDKTVGMVIKSKKPYIIETLPNIQPLLAKAEEAGRCIRLSHEHLPSVVSQIVDIAIGAGVSTALTEAVIAGCKGIHYHKKFPAWHDYYKLGFGKLVFTDLGRLLKALKDYKGVPENNPDLGDWTPYLHLLDPFRDGRAGERMGNYMRWCLEGFDAGMSRRDVIKYANTKYAAQWGSDKVIQISE